MIKSIVIKSLKSQINSAKNESNSNLEANNTKSNYNVKLNLAPILNEIGHKLGNRKLNINRKKIQINNQYIQTYFLCLV